MKTNKLSRYRDAQGNFEGGDFKRYPEESPGTVHTTGIGPFGGGMLDGISSYAPGPTRANWRPIKG